MDARIVHFPDVSQRNAGYLRWAGIACRSRATSGNSAVRRFSAVARRHNLRLRTRASYRCFRSTACLAQGTQRTARRITCFTARQRFSSPRCVHALVQEVQNRRKHNKRENGQQEARRPQIGDPFIVVAARHMENAGSRSERAHSPEPAATQAVRQGKQAAARPRS